MANSVTPSIGPVAPQSPSQGQAGGVSAAADKVGGVAINAIQSANAVPIQQVMHAAGGVTHTLNAVPINVQFGLRSSGGYFSNYTSKLSEKDVQDLTYLVIKYSQNRPDFSINLRQLKDQNGDVLEAIDGEFMNDIARLREIATNALGAAAGKKPGEYSKQWPQYLPGARAVQGQNQPFSTEHSGLLTDKAHFQKSHFQDSLDNTQEAHLDVMKRHHSATTMMEQSRNVIEEISKKLGKGHAERRKKLRAFDEKTPELPKGTSEAQDKAVRQSGQAAKAVAVLYAATHFKDLADSLTTPEKCEEARDKVEQFLEQFGYAHADRAEGGLIGNTTAFLTAGIFGLFNPFINALAGRELPNLAYNGLNDISEKSQKAVREFANSVVLLLAEGRPQYEKARTWLGGEEHSDGIEVFLVHLANKIATAQEEKDITDFMEGPIAKSALKDLHIDDQKAYLKAMQTLAVREYHILQNMADVPGNSTAEKIEAFKPAYNAAYKSQNP